MKFIAMIIQSQICETLGREQKFENANMVFSSFLRKLQEWK